MSEPKKIERLSQLSLHHAAREYLSAHHERKEAYEALTRARLNIDHLEKEVLARITRLGEQADLRSGKRLVINLEGMTFDNRPGVTGKDQVMIVDMNPTSIATGSITPDKARIYIEHVEGELS